MLVTGFSLLFIGQAIGWIFISFSVLPYMTVMWYQGELKHIPSGKTRNIDDIMSGDILGQLSPNPSPQDIALAVSRVSSGQFFGARFGITAQFLRDISSDQAEASNIVWQEALKVRDESGVERITGSVLVVALVRAFSDYRSLLAHLNLDDEDLIRGVKWQQHIRDLITEHRRPKRTGGIARDWSFGYINLLTQFGVNISEQISNYTIAPVDLEAHMSARDQLIKIFGSDGRQNAALVGQPGTGKTTIIHSFAQRLLDGSSSLPSKLKFSQVFILDSASLISAAPGRGELEKLLMSVLGEAYSAKNIILCLDNAQLFFEEAIGSVDLTNVLLPLLEAGNLRIILTMDEQRYLQIGQRNPQLINSLNRISIEEVDKDETISVMRDQLIYTEFKFKVTYTYQSLEESYRLSQRYIHDIAMPGRAIKLMESAANYSENGLVTINSVQKAIEQTVGVKVGVETGAVEREKLLNLEDLIHKRMINQSRAVGVVSDAIRRARAGVRNPNRPIGTFLFLGPTGVGKTELAKALADVYFSGENRMIRLDMNEFVRSDDVARLIADGADDPSSLTAQAMKQPFSIILLDEIEKAHPQVLSTLLQLLDEGILRDIKNREISFRDSIVIATSNAGADRIREYIDRGYKLEQFEKQFVDELINTNQFKPELLNRFDEIITFRPLSKPELVQVIDLMIAGINNNLALQKVSVTVDTEAKLLLVEKGYDPRLGARPMRRVVQRVIENTIAKKMLSGSVSPGSEIMITLDQVEQVLNTVTEAEQITNDNTAVNIPAI